MPRSYSTVDFVRDSPALVGGDAEFVAFAQRCNDIALRGAEGQLAEFEVLEAIRSTTEAFVSAWRMPDSRYLACQPDAPYASYLLFVNKQATFSIVLDVFMPGQAAVIHNHKCWCAFTCLDGLERERLYDVAPDLSSPPAQSEERICPVGQVRVLGSDRFLFHQVECASDVPTVSLHLYGADIGRLKRDLWDADSRRGGEFVTFSSEYTNEAAGLPVYLTEDNAVDRGLFSARDEPT